VNRAKKEPASEQRLKVAAPDAVANALQTFTSEGTNDHLYLNAIRAINDLAGVVYSIVDDATLAGTMTVGESNMHARHAGGHAYDAIEALLENLAGEELRLNDLREAWVASSQEAVE
jgi:hypothetical protein